MNNELSPFVETFTLADLDVMSVNADGSISSSTGYVEDKPAALPPPSDKPEEEEPTVDENGNPIDPETGLPITVDPETGEPIVPIDPETGEIMEGVLAVPPAVTDPENPGLTDPNSPGVSDPNNPGSANPGITDPNNPGGANPGATDPNNPGTADPGTTPSPDPVGPGQPAEPQDPGFIIIDPVPVE